MAELLPLTPDELLTTTRAVRKRLDLTRSVDPALVRECIEIAVQAPTGSNAQGWHFVVVTDPDLKAAIAAYYREAFSLFYGDREAAMAGSGLSGPDLAVQGRVIDSAAHLAEHLHEVPVFLIPVISGRFESGPVMIHASMWGSLFPAVWSFCLAARARGLGTCLTTLHLAHEGEVADLLGIPDTHMQGGLVAVAHSIGTEFAPAPRRDLDRIVHDNHW